MTLKGLADYETTILDTNSSEYPGLMDRLTDRPAQLFVWGELPSTPMIAIVGGRKASAAVCRYTSELCGDLVRRGFAVVSGGALGIDTAAHRGALAAGGKTVAVLGSGFDHIYPKDNQQLFEQMVCHHGAVVSEFPAHTPPTKWTFPKRNRIVAAMAQAVVVIGASARSGALITARIATSLGVPIGAVPGDPAVGGSRGCNGLIQQGARLVETAADVAQLARVQVTAPQLSLPQIKMPKSNKPKKQSGSAVFEMPTGLSEAETKIIKKITATPIHIDQIVATTGLSAASISSAILNLELSGFIEDVGGKSFVRIS